MVLELLTPANLATAVSTGAAGYALYRFAQRARQYGTPDVSSNNAAFREKEAKDDEDSKSLILAVMKHHPKNMSPKQIRDAIQFITDKATGEPMDDRLMALLYLQGNDEESLAKLDEDLFQNARLYVFSTARFD